MSARYKLEELARAAGITPRTVRYYVQRGLLPPPTFRGPETAYEAEHLHRLRVVQLLQERHWPLDAIASYLATKGEPELGSLAKGRDLPASPYRHEAAPSQDFASSPPPSRHVVPGPAPSTTVVSPDGARSTSRVTRHRLAPGLELLLDDDADATTHALVDAIVALTSRR